MSINSNSKSLKTTLSQVIKQILIKYFFFLTFLTYIGFLYKKTSLITFGNYSIVILIILFSVISFLKKPNVKILSFLIIISIIISLTILYKANTSIFIDFRDYLYLFVIILLLLFNKHLTPSKSDINFITVLYIILTILFLFDIRMNGTGELFNGALTLNFTNPNVLGSVLLTNVIYLTLGVNISSRLLIRFLLSGFIITNIYLIYLTESRTSLLLVILFLISTIIFKKRSNITSQTIKFMVFIPFIVVIFSTTIGQIAKSGIFNFTSKSGLGLNSRDVIWSDTVSQIFGNLRNFIFGADNYILYNFSNPHNAYLYLMFWFGLPLFICVFALLIININKVIKNNYNEIANVALWGFIIVLLNNSFESHLVQGLVGVTFLSLLLLSNFHLVSD